MTTTTTRTLTMTVELSADLPSIAAITVREAAQQLAYLMHHKHAGLYGAHLLEDGGPASIPHVPTATYRVDTIAKPDADDSRRTPEQIAADVLSPLDLGTGFTPTWESLADAVRSGWIDGDGLKNLVVLAAAQARA